MEWERTAILKTWKEEEEGIQQAPKGFVGSLRPIYCSAEIIITYHLAFICFLAQSTQYFHPLPHSFLGFPCLVGGWGTGWHYG